MTPTEEVEKERALLSLLHALTSISQIDLLYADQYLHRAEERLPELLPRDAYLRLARAREALPPAIETLRQEITRGNWSRVHALATEAARIKETLAAHARALEVADAVYGPRILHAGATALALNGVVAHPGAALERERAGLVERLRVLAIADPAGEALYRVRAAHFERVQVVTDEQPGPVLSGQHLQSRLLAALERAEFTEVGRLTAAVVTAGGNDAVARVRVPAPADHDVQALARPVPESAIRQAAELGLAQATLPTSIALNEYLGCGCGERPRFPEEPLSESRGAAQACTCGHACPPEVPAKLREALDWMLLHPFMSSFGTRYLPWFGAETLLIESFAEADADARTPLLEALGLPRRRGLSRLTIEDGLRSRTARICTSLGLDPLEFVVACVPFDAYLRLAPGYGWGRERLWTHFDGYQVTRELSLHALVGGDAAYGGAADLCAVQRDYDAERLVARFCILRRQRFVARHAPEGSSVASPP